jgi:hypothetical protein
MVGRSQPAIARAPAGTRRRLQELGRDQISSGRRTQIGVKVSKDLMSGGDGANGFGWPWLIVDAPRVTPRLARLTAKRVDSLFATSRPEERPDERPSDESFENFGDDMPTPRPLIVS